jgi:hypothetical protein
VTASNGWGDEGESPRTDEEARDHRGRLRLPAYILIMLVLAVAAIVVLTAVLLVLLHSAGDASGLPIQAEGARPCA